MKYGSVLTPNSVIRETQRKVALLRENDSWLKNRTIKTALICVEVPEDSGTITAAFDHVITLDDFFRYYGIDAG